MRGWGMQGCRPRPKHVKPGGRQQKQSCSSRATARRKHLDVCRARSNDEFKRALPLLHSRVVLKLPRCAEIPICPGGLTNVPLNEKCDGWDGYNKRIRWIRNGEFPHEACLSLRVLLVHYIPRYGQIKHRAGNPNAEVNPGFRLRCAHQAGSKRNACNGLLPAVLSGGVT